MVAWLSFTARPPADAKVSLGPPQRTERKSDPRNEGSPNLIFLARSSIRFKITNSRRLVQATAELFLAGPTRYLKNLKDLL